MRTTRGRALRKTLCAFAGLCLALGVFVWRYTTVNAACPAPTQEVHLAGEPVLHNGVAYTLSDSRVLGGEEFCEQYGIDPVFVVDEEAPSKVVLVKLYAKNVSDKPVDVEFNMLMLLQLGNYQCTYMNYMPLFVRLNPDAPLEGTMLPGHDITLLIPYQFNEYAWNKAEFANLENETAQMVFSIYPVKKTILLNEKTGART